MNGDERKFLRKILLERFTQIETVLNQASSDTVTQIPTEVPIRSLSPEIKALVTRWNQALEELRDAGSALLEAGYNANSLPPRSYYVYSRNDNNLNPYRDEETLAVKAIDKTLPRAQRVVSQEDSAARLRFAEVRKALEAVKDNLMLRFTDLEDASLKAILEDFESQVAGLAEQVGLTPTQLYLK